MQSVQQLEAMIVEYYARYKGELTPSLFADDDKPSWIKGGTATKSSDWDESKHPRVEKGSKAAHGGQFTKAKQQSLAGLTMAETVGKVGAKPDYDKRLEDLKERRDPDGIESNEKLPLFEEAAKVFEESAKKPAKVQEEEEEEKPVESIKTIPLRERKAYAESLAMGGMLQADIADHLMKRGVASVDARKLASDATFAASEHKGPNVIRDTQNDAELLAKQIGKTVHVAKVKSTGQIVAISDEQTSDPRVDVISSHGSKPESGIVMPSKTIPNEEAKPGDQLGLFGDATKAPKTAFKPKLIDQPAKQGGLFDTKGNPDQMDLFGDGVMPDALVYKPEASEQKSEKDKVRTNPFRDKADEIRRKAESLSPGGSARDKAMKNAFPLGTGRPGNASSQRTSKQSDARIEKSIDDAKKALALFDQAKAMDARADSFDAGHIDENGMRTDAGRKIDQEKAEKKQYAQETKAAATEHLHSYMRETLKPGQNVFIAENPDNSVEIKRVNPKSITTTSGSTWKYDELIPPSADGKRAMSTKEMVDVIKARMGDKQPEPFKPKLLDQKKSDDVASGPKDGDKDENGLVFRGGRWHREDKPNTLLSTDELANPASVPKAKDDSFTYGDAVKTPSGKVGIMSGSGGMGSDRVGVNYADGTSSYESSTELKKADESEHPEGFTKHSNEYAEHSWRPNDVSASDWDAKDREDQRLYLRGKAKQGPKPFEPKLLDKPSKAPAPAKGEYSAFDPTEHGDYKNLLNLGKKIDSGELTHEQFKAAHKMYTENGEAFKADLMKRYNAQQLKNIAGNFGDFRAGDNRKEENAHSVYEKLMTNAFDIGDGMSRTWGMSELRNPNARIERLAAHVEKQTPESLAAHVEATKARSAERENEKAAERERLSNPQTIDDYRDLIRATDGGYSKLESKHQEAYDALMADKSRSERMGEKVKKAEVKQLSGEGKNLDFSLTKNFHSKRGTDIFTATPNARVDRDSYDEMNAAAKKLGGWYYKKFGATPEGFHFPTEEARNKFMELQKGNVDRSAELADNQKASHERTAERLTEAAERITDRANDELNRDRKTNTFKRAGEAASAQANARKQVALGETLKRVADHIATGNAKHLTGIKHATHIQALNQAIGEGKYSRWQSQKDAGNGQSYEKFMEQDDSASDIQHVEYPHPHIWTHDLREIASSFEDEPGLKKIAAKMKSWGSVDPEFKKSGNNKIKFSGGELVSPSQIAEAVKGGEILKRNVPVGHSIRVHKIEDPRVVKQVGRPGPFYTADGGKTVADTPTTAVVGAFNKGHELDTIEPPEEKRLTVRNADAIETMQEALSKLKRRANPKLRRAADNLAWALEKHNRMKAADIHNVHELKSALREYMPLRKKQESEDPIKKAERGLVGRKIDGFFPTPRSVVDQMLEHADIQKGHSVLEPSAGKGDILDAVNERHSDDDLSTHALELDSGLRDLLKLKGHNVVGNNFLEHKGKYDRILMNPPFERGQDMEHVKHAYEQLNPGGKLVAIMAHGGTGKRNDFDKWVHESGGEVMPLDQGSFNTDEAFRKTGVNTKMVVLTKPHGEQSKDNYSFTSFEPVLLEQYSEPARPFIDDGDLLYDPVREQYASALSCLVERYEWTASLHPRDRVGRFTKTRQLADHPDLQSHHSLNIKNQDQATARKLNDHRAGFRNLLANATRKAQFQQDDPNYEPDEETVWANVDKTALQAMLAKINQADHESMKGDGPKFHELVNANQIIPKMVAERLHGGSRFFDPEKLRGRWNEAKPEETPQAQQQQPESTPASQPESSQPEKDSPVYTDAVEALKSLGHKPTEAKRLVDAAKSNGDHSDVQSVLQSVYGKPKPSTVPQAEAKSQPQDVTQSDKPKRAPITPESLQGVFGEKLPEGVSKAMNTKLERRIKSTIGDDPEIIKAFKPIVFHAWKQLTQEANDNNQAIRQVTNTAASLYDSAKHDTDSVSAPPQKLTALIRMARNGSLDPAAKKGFDLMVDNAQRNYPQYLAGRGEDGFVDWLTDGIKPQPNLLDPEVGERAVTLAGADFFRQFDQGEPPEQDEPQGDEDWNDQFSWSVARVMVERYRKDLRVERYGCQPTDAQRKAGNYKMEHIRVHGLPISIETKKGDKRRPQWPSLAADYGYIKRTLGKDGDHIDVFVGPDKSSEMVFVIDQVGLNGKFDEHKVLLGFANQADAIATYRKCYHNGWKVGPVTAMTIAQFKNWITSGKHSRPIGKQVSRYSMFEPKLLASV
jgi:hypothetical protein